MQIKFNGDNICDCEECQSGKYNQTDYVIKPNDFLNLDKNRPLGLTGHLRAKNEALTIAQCIDSCIEFLDELIITYNDSFDATEEIIRKYEKLYPNKIRVYHYKPTVTPHTWSYRHIDLNKTMAFPEDYSIHNPANYYNFGYIKTSFKYYMKIDADQVYFTTKLLKLKEKLMTIDENYSNNPIVPIDQYIKENCNSKEDFSLVLGGINLRGSYNSFSIPIKNAQTFNGCSGDHTIMIPDSKKIYRFDKKKMWETIKIGKKPFSAGFVWLHFGTLKLVLQGQNLNTNVSEFDYSLEKFANSTWDMLMENSYFKKEQVERKIYIYNGENWWEHDRTYMLEIINSNKLDSILYYYKLYLEKRQLQEEANLTKLDKNEYEKLINQYKSDIINLEEQINQYKSDIINLKEQEKHYKKQVNKYKGQVSYHKTKVNKIKGQLNYHKKEKEHITFSISYKLGRAITWLPRKLRDIFTS